MLQKHLEVFEALLLSLNGPNVALCGAMALQAHGLILGRDPSDLDVAIYSPTKKQADYLAVLKTVGVKGTDDYPIEMCGLIKIEKDGLRLDILIEHGKEILPDLLLREFKGNLFKVQDIAYGITVKNSFRTKDKKHRPKDVEDMLSLKTLNFNL